MATTNEKVGLTLDLRGVDMVTPGTDLLSDGRTPWSKNFRLYATQSDDRQVAVSSRKGPGEYMAPLVSTLTDSETSTGNGEAAIGVTRNIQAQSFVASGNGVISSVDIRVARDDSPTGPLLVSLYSDDNGKPSRLLSTSSIPGGDISGTFEWHKARFLKAPTVSEDDVIWIVLEIQDDGSGTYKVETVDSGTSLYSDASFAALTTVNYSVLFRAYTSPSGKPKGSFRFNRDNGDNISLVVYDRTVYALDPADNTWDVVVSTMSAAATEYSFLSMDGKAFWVNGYDALHAWDGTTLETITDPQLPILSMITSHKDRIFGVVANDRNKFVWCEAPGNPTNLPTNQQWYYQWLSTSFQYAPAPKTGSPIVGLLSFQDALTIFTEDNKYVFSGYDAGSFILRKANGSKGALSMRGITSDENYVYFAATDGLYEWNGSKDTNISLQRVQPLFDGCPNKHDITPVIWNNKVRFYMASRTSAVNDICLLYNRGLDGEFEIDTNTWVDRAIKFDDADDGGELLEFSSLYAMPMLAETQYSSLGAPIDFEYRFKYDSFGLPAQKKRIRRYYPILQGVDTTFPVTLAMDKDFQDRPKMKKVLLEVKGSQWGGFDWGDGTLWGGDKSFKHHRQSYSGSAYYWQLRVSRNAVNNRVAFSGSQYKYRIKRM